MLPVNLPVCHACPAREQPCEANCRCLESGRRYVDHARAGDCPLGKFPDPTDPGTLARLAHGAAGIAKALVGADRAAPEVIAHRQRTCAACPHATMLAGLVATCALCGCIIRAKIKLKGERCPDGRW